MDVRSPNRLSDHCRTRDDTELAMRRKRPFSGSDKYLEEYKQRAEPLLGECLSFVFVTLCDTDLQHLSLRCVWLSVHVVLSLYMCAHMNEETKIHSHISTLSKLLCLWRNSSAEPKFQPD